jgi:hypothetical protein
METVGGGLSRAGLPVRFVWKMAIGQLKNAALRLHERIQRLLNHVLGRGMRPNHTHDRRVAASKVGNPRRSSTWTKRLPNRDLAPIEVGSRVRVTDEHRSSLYSAFFANRLEVSRLFPGRRWNVNTDNTDVWMPVIKEAPPNA